ncbi:MAG: hypothetical protein GY796_12585 [Chloroflexi bacterium]|nr:hypothetical protein [Chloroflexota bacterium]
MMKKLKPGQRLAFLPEAEVKMMAECLAAFANGDGGLIVLGIDEQGQETETIWEEEAEGALREAAGLCRPPVPSRWQPVDGKNGTLIGINVPRSADLHTLYDGCVLIRSGNWNRPLSGDEVRALANSKNTAEFETSIVPGARPSDLNRNIIRDYLDRRDARGAAKIISTLEPLFEIGATDRDGNPTTIDILLFGKNPQVFFPQSGIVFVKFVGTELRGEDGDVGYGRHDELTGPLSRIIDRAWNVIYEEMRVGATVNKLEREELKPFVTAKRTSMKCLP